MNNYAMNFGDQMMMSYMNIQPSNVKGRANLDTEYNKRYLWNKIYSQFKFTIPQEWKLNWFRYWLFQFGSIAVVYTHKFGWIAYPYSILSHDLYYNPKRVLVNCKFVDETIEGVVGLNCGIVHAMDDYFGLDDLVTRYATQLSLIDKDIQINLMNANLSMVYLAENDKDATEVKLAWSQMQEGKPLTIVQKDKANALKGKSGLVDTMIANPKQLYLVNDLLDSRRTIVNEFLTEIGVNNANTDKKERLVTAEVNANNEEVKCLVEVIRNNIQMSFDEINRISDLNLRVELVQNDVNSDIIKESNEEVAE